MIYSFLCGFHSKGYPCSKNWTLDFAPAFSPRFSPTLSPRSFFHTRQRFPLPNHVTSGCMSPRSYFHTWSAVSPSQKHVTSGSGYDVILTSKRGKRPHTSGVYYSYAFLYKLDVSHATWHTELAPAVLAAVKTEFSYVIICHHNIGYIPIWITSCHFSNCLVSNSS